MIILPISLTFAAALTIINFWLSLRIGRLRISEKIMHGDGGNAVIQKRMRAHSNFVEYAPFVLILLVLVELAWGPATWLWVVAAAYVVGRILHPLGMDSDALNKLRGIGIGLNHLVMLILAGAALYAAYGHSSKTQVKTFSTNDVPATIEEVPAE